MSLIPIGEVAARTGVNPSAIRYYEGLGLINDLTKRKLREVADLRRQGKKTPDLFDWLGAAICLIGVSVIMWAPRR